MTGCPELVKSIPADVLKDKFSHNNRCDDVVTALQGKAIDG
jgi:hypothetical protein